MYSSGAVDLGEPMPLKPGEKTACVAKLATLLETRKPLLLAGKKEKKAYFPRQISNKRRSWRREEGVKLKGH